jgi:hypothetical protein
MVLLHFYKLRPNYTTYLVYGPNHRKKARASHKLLLFVYFHTICAKEMYVIFGPTNYVTQPSWPMSLGCVYGLVDLVMVVGVRGKHKLRMDQKHFPAMARACVGRRVL